MSEKNFPVELQSETSEELRISALRCTEKISAPEHADRMREREEEEAPTYASSIEKQSTEKAEECGPEVTELIRGGPKTRKQKVPGRQREKTKLK